MKVTIGAIGGALLALVGVIIVQIVSILTTRRQLRNEIYKIKTAIEQNFSIKILDERKVRYPELYSHLSSFARDIEMIEKGYEGLRPLTSKAQLVKFKELLEQLDAKHALFFSVKTSYAFRDLRVETYRQLMMLKSSSDIPNKKNIAVLRIKIGRAELALKNDLGILIDEFQEIRSKYNEKDYDDFPQFQADDYE